MLDQAVAVMRDAGHQIKSLSTTSPGSASEIARCCLDQGADLILVAGGDGTINEVVNGMVYSNVPLGILPGGTANVLAVETGIGGNLLTAAKQLEQWIPERISIGLKKNGSERPNRYFLMMCGAGLDAHIVYHLSAPLKAVFGKIAYWIGGFAQLGRQFPEFEVVANGASYRSSFTLVSRVRNYGGDLDIAPSINLLDDEFELVMFEGRNSFRYLRYILNIVRGRLMGSPGVTVLRAQQVRITASAAGQIHTQVDGEYGGPAPISIELVPRALTILLPQKYRAKRPVALLQDSWTTSPTRSQV